MRRSFRKEESMKAKDLIPYQPAMPAHVDYEQGVLNGPDVVTPILMTLYNSDPQELGPLLGSQNHATSPNGAIWADKTIVAQMVKAYNAKNGKLAIIGDATIATVSGWVSWGSRRLGIGRSQLLEKARHAYLAAQSATPSATPAE
jgi:hypothetical protein